MIGNQFINKIKIFILKRKIVETLGNIEFCESQLTNARTELEKRTNKNKLGMTTNELNGHIAFLENQLANDKQNLPQMKEQLRRLQTL